MNYKSISTCDNVCAYTFFIYLQPGTEEDITSNSDYEDDNEAESSERNKNDDNMPFSFDVMEDLSQSDQVNKLILHKYKDKAMTCLTIDCTQM